MPLIIAAETLFRFTIAGRARRLIFEPSAAYFVRNPMDQNTENRLDFLLDLRTTVGHPLRFPGRQYILSFDAYGECFPCVDHRSAGSDLFTFPIFRICGIYFAPGTLACYLFFESCIFFLLFIWIDACF